MDGRLGTPLQSFASVARTFEGAEGLPPQSPEKASRQRSRQSRRSGLRRANRKSSAAAYVQLQKMRGRAEPEASDSDGSSGCSDATELDPVDRAPRSSAAQLRRYVTLPHIEAVRLSSDLVGSIGGRAEHNPWAGRGRGSRGTAKGSTAERLQGVAESRIKAAWRAEGAEATRLGRQPSGTAAMPTPQTLLAELKRALASTPPLLTRHPLPRGLLIGNAQWDRGGTSKTSPTRDGLCFSSV
eukprot:jgi/Tetstr1/420500/TSEL_011613.t1